MLLQLALVFSFISCLSTSYKKLRPLSVYSAVNLTEKKKPIIAYNTWPGIAHGYFQPFVLGGSSCGSNQLICWVANKTLLRTSYLLSGLPFCLACTAISYAVYYTKVWWVRPIVDIWYSDRCVLHIIYLFVFFNIYYFMKFWWKFHLIKDVFVSCKHSRMFQHPFLPL